MDQFVERSPIDVLRVRGDLSPGGPAAAFDHLESKLASIKGRKFYGSFQKRAGGEEYYACVERMADDDPMRMGLEPARLPGGLYVRRKLANWPLLARTGQIPVQARDLIARHDLDPTRPELEYYRSHTELHLLVPVASRQERAIP
jgi:hypothetical protein